MIFRPFAIVILALFFGLFAAAIASAGFTMSPTSATWESEERRFKQTPWLPLGQPCVVGQDMGGSNGMQAFAWNQSGGMVNLQTLLQTKYGNVASSSASGVNASGQVVGMYTDTATFTHVFLYSTAAGTITNLDSYAGYNHQVYGIQTVTGINGNGKIAGTYFWATMTATPPIRWRDVPKRRQLRPVPKRLYLRHQQQRLAGWRRPAVVRRCPSRHLQRHAVVVAQQPGRNHQSPGPCLCYRQQRRCGRLDCYQRVHRRRHAFYYNYSTGTMIDLGVLSGQSASTARGINDRSQVVAVSGACLCFRHDRWNDARPQQADCSRLRLDPAVRNGHQ